MKRPPIKPGDLVRLCLNAMPASGPLPALRARCRREPVVVLHVLPDGLLIVRTRWFILTAKSWVRVSP